MINPLILEVASNCSLAFVISQGRKKHIARPGLEPRTSRTPCEHSDPWATKCLPYPSQESLYSRVKRVYLSLLSTKQPIGGVLLKTETSVFSIQSNVSFLVFHNTVMILSFRTAMPGQTVQTQIRLLLEEQSDLGLHCLPFHLHRLDSLLYGRAI